MKLTEGWGVAEDRMSSVMDSLRRTVLAGCQADLTDGQLLENYLSRRDEAAVAALVRRHGPMVWGCAAGCSAATMTPRTLFKPPS